MKLKRSRLAGLVRTTALLLALPAICLGAARPLIVSGIGAYATHEVPKLTGARQHPWVSGVGMNFPLAVVTAPKPDHAIQHGKEGHPPQI